VRREYWLAPEFHAVGFGIGAASRRALLDASAFELRGADRPQLKKLLAAVGQGDVVIIAAVDRLSRDTTDLMVIARDLQRAGAGLRSLAEPVVDTTSDFAELVLAMLGVAAKLERRRIKERTARGRADAKANGVKFGRKPKLTAHQKREAVRRRDNDGETLRSIARSYNVSAATISRLAT
jgi:DNA invertase Pin-like site-specific DNA recombinase